MEDEKLIRISISGDASDLNKEIQRTKQNLKDAFTNINLGDALSGVDSQFSNVNDKINTLKSTLQSARAKSNSTFDTMAERGNDAYKNKIESLRKASTDKFDKASTALENFSKTMTSQIARKQVQNARSNNVPGVGGNAGGNNVTTALQRGFQTLARGGNASSVINATRGGLVGGSATGAGGVAGGVIAAASTALAIAAIIGKGMVDGWEQVRRDNKNNAVFSQAYRGSYDASSGMDSNDYAAFALQTAQSRGSGNNIGEETIRRAYLKNAFGVSDGDTQQFDRFAFQGGSDPTVIIAEILKRSESKGLLGVNKGDFARIPQALQTVSGIMGMQKNSSEKVDEGYAANLLLSGQGIGGRFADDRLGSVMQGMNAGIQSPQNGGMKAYIFEMLKRANPNASYTDILAKQEDGASAENMKAILPDIMRMPQGEMRRMVLKQLGMKQQDANRLDSDGNLEKFLGATEGTGKMTKDDNVYEKIRDRSDSFVLEQDKIVDNAMAAWRSFWGNVMTALDSALKGVSGSQQTGRSTDWQLNKNMGNRFNNTTKPANLNGH